MADRPDLPTDEMIEAGARAAYLATFPNGDVETWGQSQRWKDDALAIYTAMQSTSPVEVVKKSVFERAREASEQDLHLLRKVAVQKAALSQSSVQPVAGDEVERERAIGRSVGKKMNDWVRNAALQSSSGVSSSVLSEEVVARAMCCDEVARHYQIIDGKHGDVWASETDLSRERWLARARAAINAFTGGNNA